MRQKKASFGKGERLCGVKAVSDLFAGGKTIILPSFRVIYRVMPGDKALCSARVLISVPKRHFRKAVDRNLMRRRIREAWRLNKLPIVDRLSERGMRIDLALVWLDTEIRPWDMTEKRVREVIERLMHLKY